MNKICLVTLVAVSLYPLTTYADGFDYQSPEEIEAARQIIAQDFAGAVEPEMLSLQAQVDILNRYPHLDPHRWVPSDLLKTAVLYFAANKARFQNQNYITVVDFKPRSNN